MSIYKPTWDLSTIPDEAWYSENGRRAVSKRPPGRTRAKLKPCVNPECGNVLTSTQRRQNRKCPVCKTPQGASA